LVLTIDSVAVAGPPVVEFNVKDENGFPYIGVTSSDVRFTFAKLIAGTNGDASHWQSYVNKLETPTVGPGVTPMIQATTDGAGTLVNHMDGKYSYTFFTNVTQVTSPLAVAYDSAATHRLGMSLNKSSLGVDAVNATYDFVPLTGSTTLVAKRDIVTVTSCNECHGRLAVHGGSRVDTKFCVTCHNPGSTDANSGNTVDFKVMVHKIHQGADLPSVIAGGAYYIYGFNDQLHDFSTVKWPQDTTNCTKCHDPADAATPQAHNYNDVPTMQACGACHDDVNFATGANHPGGVVTSNADCVVCHHSGGFAGSPAETHLDPILVEADNWAFEIISVINSAPTQFPTVRYRIYNPITNVAYALTDPAVSSGSLTARMAWDTRDYHNTGTATATSAPASAASLALLTGATNNGDGSYSKTFTFAVPAAATGSGAMSLEGRAAVDVEGPAGPPDGTRDRIPIQSFVTYFTITDVAAVPRREVVETARCQNCHGRLNGLVLHGGSRADNTKLCVMCHNPDNTDVAQRPVDPDGIVNGVNTAAGDGLEEQSVDFRNLVHSIHSADMRTKPFFVYGNSGSTNDFSGLRFPGRLNQCETCHLPDTYIPASDTSQRLGVTLASGSTVTQRTPSVILSPAGANANLADDLNVTPIAAACRGCHDSSLAQQHMQLNGALFTALQTTLTGTTPETCAICHGDGRTADVKLVHGIKD
jgi:OmcA/MtrC family decaheme c-type cytochrome